VNAAVDDNERLAELCTSTQPVSKSRPNEHATGLVHQPGPRNSMITTTTKTASVKPMIIL
jgi:hypothetical protein